jgi:hypothetical protein
MPYPPKSHKFSSIKPKIQQEVCENFHDFVVFIPYMLKFSNSKIKMQNQKLQIILIIRH